MMIPLIRERCPVTLTPDQQDLYENIFADVFNKRMFKDLYNNCIKRKTVTVEGQQIAFQGSEFKHLVILGDVVAAKAAVELTLDDDRVLNASMPSWSWVGVLEFVEHMTKAKGSDLELGKYGVTAKVTQMDVEARFNYYKVNVVKFKKYCQKSGGKGLHYKNGMLAKMLSYTTDYMQSQKDVYDKAYRYSLKSDADAEGVTRREIMADVETNINTLQELDDEMVNMTENSDQDTLKVNN